MLDKKFNHSEAAKRYKEYKKLDTFADMIAFIRHTTHMTQDIYDDFIINMAINDDSFIKKSIKKLKFYSSSYLIKIYLPTRLSFDEEVIDIICEKSKQEDKFLPFMAFKAWFNSRLFTWKEKLDSYDENIDIFRKLAGRIPKLNLTKFRSGLSKKVDEAKEFIEILNKQVPKYLTIDSLNELATEFAITDLEFLKNKEIQYKMMKDALHVDFPYDDDLLKLACCNDDHIKDEQFEELLVKYGKEMISEIYLRSRIDFKFINYLG